MAAEAESLLMAVALAVMIVTLLAASLIRFVPGPVLVWFVGVVAAYLNDFDRVTVIAVILMTIFMLIGSTSDLWLRYFGMQNRGGSCWGTLGSIFGGILGTFFIPIPILGTLIGAVLGAVVVEFLRVRETQHTLQVGRSVLEMYIMSMIIEFTVGGLIVLVFGASLWLTA